MAELREFVQDHLCSERTLSGKLLSRILKRFSLVIFLDVKV